MGYLLLHSSAWAVPSLGVATGEIYFTTDGDPFEAYQDFFASGTAPGTSAGVEEGFAIGASGESIFVWSKIMDKDIWLLAENVFNGNNLSLDGVLMDTDFGGSVASYENPYLGINLGPVRDDIGNINSGWEALPDDPFPGDFYVFTGVLTYTGDLPVEGYFFAVADSKTQASFNRGADKFSPRTTSSLNAGQEIIPEPATIALLGIGLAGLAGGMYLRRRRQKKE